MAINNHDCAIPTKIHIIPITRLNAEVNLYDGSDWPTVDTRQAVVDSTNQIGGFVFNLSAVCPQ
jgi:hypothetical protein